MSSINTNAAAMTALQTLKATNKGMDITQNRISTGYRVSEAAHNAAYWSIATTMRSDNKAMSTVQDALGLGAAQVDVAYTAMDASKDILDEIKTKLVAASQPGVDKSKIQSEIKSLQNSLKSIADSASFSGGNWLSVDSKASNFKEVESVIAAFTRSENGAITLGKVDVEVGKIALFDKNGAGLLQKAEGIDNAGVLAESGTSGVSSQATMAITAALTSAAGDLTFDITIDGVTTSINAGPLAANATAAQVTAAIQTKIDDGTLAGFSVTSDATGVVLKSQTSFSITNGAINGAPTAVLNTAADTISFNGTVAEMVFDDDDAITFTLNVDGTNHDIRIDKATIDAEGTAAAGTIADAAEFVAVLNKALANANITDATASVSGGKVTITNTSTSADMKLEISNLRHSSGSAAFDVLELDITTASTEQLAGYIQGIDDMLTSVTTAASDLGAIKSRIDMQADFVSKLMDALDRGIGQLVDADMEAESTRLQALQVQQQLGVQALSIANGNTQNILSLFRS